MRVLERENERTEARRGSRCHRAERYQPISIHGFAAFTSTSLASLFCDTLQSLFLPLDGSSSKSIWMFQLEKN